VAGGPGRHRWRPTWGGMAADRWSGRGLSHPLDARAHPWQRRGQRSAVLRCRSRRCDEWCPSRPRVDVLEDGSEHTRFGDHRQLSVPKNSSGSSIDNGLSWVSRVSHTLPILRSQFTSMNDARRWPARMTTKPAHTGSRIARTPRFTSGSWCQRVPSECSLQRPGRRTTITSSNQGPDSHRVGASV